MPFTPRIDADFYGNARLFIRGNEGLKPIVYNPGDHEQKWQKWGHSTFQGPRDLRRTS